MLSEFWECLYEAMVTKNGKMHFFYRCIVLPEGVLHLLNVSVLQHSCKPVPYVMNKCSKTEVLETPGVQVVTAKKTPEWMYRVFFFSHSYRAS